MFHLSRYDQVQTKNINVNLSEQLDSTMHKIRLPAEGQYAFDFKLCSHPCVINGNDQAIQIYIVQNDVEKVGFSPAGNIDHTIFETDIPNYPRSVRQIVPIYETNLAFVDNPIVTESLYKSDPTIFIKLREPPKMNYWISYKVAYIHNQYMQRSLRDEPVDQLYNGRLYRYQNGKIRMYKNY